MFTVVKFRMEDIENAEKEEEKIAPSGIFDSFDAAKNWIVEDWKNYNVPNPDGMMKAIEAGIGNLVNKPIPQVFNGFIYGIFDDEEYKLMFN